MLMELAVRTRHMYRKDYLLPEMRYFHLEAAPLEIWQPHIPQANMVVERDLNKCLLDLVMVAKANGASFPSLHALDWPSLLELVLWSSPTSTQDLKGHSMFPYACG